MAQPRGINWLTSIGFVALGAGYLWEATRRDRSTAVPGPTPQELEGLRRSRRALNAAPAGKPMVVKDGVRSIRFYPAGSIDNRVKFIVDQIRRDSADKKTITEARAIVSGKCRADAGGLRWCVPIKSWTDELRMIYFAITNPNSPYAVRYTRDHATIDLFGSSDLMRRLPAEDCDGLSVRVGALCRAIGYAVKCRVVAPAGQPNQWAHIYIMVGDEPGNPNPRRWLALDASEPQNPPFWEVPKRLISTVKDFDV
jgi:hypothetical protein